MKAIVVIAIAFLAICSGNSVYNLRFDELLRALEDTSHLQDSEKMPQVLDDCSNKTFAPFECCPDNKTPRNGFKNEGCGVKLCIDESVSDCEKVAQSKCDTSPTIYNKCHYKCNPQCRKSPSARCTEERHVYGCCWNGYPKLSPNSKCPECIDNPDMSHICHQYKDVSAGCNSGSLGIRQFLLNYCPFTCKLCSKY
ncbi:uncharacterized protein LOC110246987 [Exaiptasia diaphana]|uniref:ShKT domain-containing protein n=1 Tax=Exaiptasia diaphana TaxID=2652724 RepID=A0A913XSI0_EXADI|nr:uncharacterized protein LOC110246987 [Exaiptasia diaphana]